MDLMPILPLAYYGLASLLTILCLSEPPLTRQLVVVPVLVLSILALVEAKRLTWPLGLNSTFASMVVFYLPYSIKLLLLDAENEEGKGPQTRRSFVECYRLWNNPRGLLVSSGPIIKSSSRGDQTQRTKSNMAFAGRQALKMAGLWAFDSQVFQRVLFQAFTTFELEDVSPAMELPSVTVFMNMSASQHYFRAIISMQWIWGAYFFLTFYHSLLSVFFVSIAGFDKPKEWPALFGSILEGKTIRGFWGRYWHRLTIPTYAYYARMISHRVMGISKDSRADKTFIAMFIFFFSGVSHSLVGWAMGDSALARDVLFFVANFAASALETTISKMYKPDSSRRQESVPAWSSLISTVLGLLRTFLFFYVVAPLWMYPKMYAPLVTLMGGSL